MFYGWPVILFHFLISMLPTFYSLLDCRSSVFLTATPMHSVAICPMIWVIVLFWIFPERFRILFVDIRS